MNKKIFFSLFSILVLGAATFSNATFGASAEESENLTRYEAEDAEVINAKIKGHVDEYSIDYGNYSGLGFVGEIDLDTSAVIFSVTVPETGNYRMYVGYAIGTDFGPATMNVTVNDEFFSSISLTERNGWGAFDVTTPLKTTVNLDAGLNKVKISHSINYAELDYIDIGDRLGDKIEPGQQAESDISKPQPGYTRYEAEDATHNGYVYRQGTFSGTGYVGELNNTGSSYISFTVNATEKAEYSLHVAYAVGIGYESASFKVHNDAGFYTIAKCEEKLGWGLFDLIAIADITISLNEGKNTISLYKNAGWAQVDFIDVSDASIGEYRDSTVEVQTPNLEEGYTRYEAEDGMIILAERKGIKYFYDVGEYSGYGYVGCLDGDRKYVEISVNAPEAGEYEIKYCYAAFESGSSLRFYTGRHGRGGHTYYYNEVTHTNAHGWGMFAADTIMTTRVCLEKGENYILVRGGLISAELDYIDIDWTKKTGEYYKGTLEESLERNNPAY